MEKLPRAKLHHLDLAKRRAELEDIFESVIKRMPDLCMPPSYRYAGEDDYFNCTRGIKLIPFRKQENFAKCISPEPENRVASGSNANSKKLAGAKSKQTSDKNIQEDTGRVFYDKLFKKFPSKNYPFANPIADCMLTDNNIDNLREIIVSSLNIEWKMLTPFRLESDYEEKYFDKLFQLHRNRYRSRLESGYFASNQKVPFKHTRHAYLVQYGFHKRCRTPTRSSLDKIEVSSKHDEAKLTIPTLTLTSDEKPISDLDVAENEDEIDDYDYQEYNYENFSRYQRDEVNYNLKNLKQSLANSEDEIELDLNIRQQNMNYNDELEDQVEDIISHLIGAD